MRTITKRLGTLICCLVLAAALTTAAAAAPTQDCPGNCTHAAAIGTTHYPTVQEAIAAATDGSTLTLLASGTVSKSVVIDKAITLDLGGNTLTGQNTEDEALLTVTKDLTVKNGTLTTDAGAIVLATDCAVTVDKTASLVGGNDVVGLILLSIDGQATANISGQISNQGAYPAVVALTSGSKSCVLRVTKSATVTSADFNAIELYGSGKLEISGGTFQAKENVTVLNISEGETLEASITGGKFHAENGEAILVKAEQGATVPSDFVIGGTFNKVPSTYVPSFCRTAANADGTYTVTAAYTVSFDGNGGSGSMTSLNADRGTSITLPKCTYSAPCGMHFRAWEIGGKEYNPGASYAVNGNLTMKALWAKHSGGTASCTSKAVCTVCGAAYGELASHRLTASSGYGATCTSQGMHAHSKCSSCGQFFVNGVSISSSSLSMPALGHDMKPQEGKDATCTEDGLMAHEICSHCGLIQVAGNPATQEQLVIPAAGHTLEQVAAVASTCTQPGVAAHERCSVCKGLFLNNAPTTKDALATELGSHVLSDWQSDAAIHWKSCTECGEVFRQHSHKDADGSEACDDCGCAMPAAQETVPEAGSGFSMLFLVPMIAAVAIAASLVLKKRK